MPSQCHESIAFFHPHYLILSNSLCRKLLWMIALEALEVLLNLTDLCVVVARGDNLLGALYQSALVVKSIEQYGQFGLQGYVVEALFPLGLAAARTFGRDAQAELLRLASLLGNNVCHAAVLLPIHRYAPHATEDGTQWPEEPLFLHHKTTLEPFSPHEKQGHDEIPVRGMWREGNNIFLWALHRLLEMVTQTAVEHPATKLL